MKNTLKSVFLSFAIGVAAIGSAQDLIIVRLADSVYTYGVAGTYRLMVVDRTIGAPFAYYRTGVGTNLEALRAAMAADARVLWVEDDQEVECPENQSGGKGSTVAAISDRNTLATLNANVLSKISFSETRAFEPGRTVKIAILDTGIARRAYNLWRRVVRSANFVESGHSAYDHPMNADTNGNLIPDEGVGHGTFIAGIVDQVAPLCPLVVVRVADSDGISTAWKLVKGIAFAVTEGCEVVSISLGADDTVAALSDTCEWAEVLGTVVVGAAGNLNQPRAFNPARLSSGVCVTGVDHVDRKASFANWDSAVECSAPATGIKSTWIDGTAVIWNGTSFAAPWVAGGIADTLRRRPRAYVEAIVRVSGRAGDGINAINPLYQGKLGVRLNLFKLNNSIMGLPIRP